MSKNLKEEIPFSYPSLNNAVNQKSFDPESYGLPKDFILTKYSKLKGWGCKVSQADLIKLLEGIGNEEIGMDCSIMPSKQYKDLFIVSTTDFFYPLINDPYLQGRIGCANVLSDMYALGITNIDNVLMILGVSNGMSVDMRNIVTRKMIEGFNDGCKLGQTVVTGGQSVINPWPIIGGVAKSICKKDDFIRPEYGEINDVIILTKPLGTQVAINLHEWELEGINNDNYKYVYCDNKNLIDKETSRKAFNIAVGSMVRLNRNAAILMHKYNAHGATDVTGFGILGHANNLIKHQLKYKTGIELYIDTLPCIVGMSKIAKNDKYAKRFKLLQGYSSETSGGLLIMMSQNNALKYIQELQQLDQWPAFIIGKVRKQNDANAPNRAIIADQKDLTIIDVDINTKNYLNQHKSKL